MADSKLTALAALTTPDPSDILYIVDDPGGTPVSKKITLANVLGRLPDTQLLAWGDGTASFPAFKRSTTAIHARLADDSDFTNIFARGVTVDNLSTGFVATFPGELNVNVDSGGLHMIAGGVVSWSDSGTTAATTRDLFLFRDAANTLALRNSTNAQAFNLYNTYTSGSVYERGFMRWASNVLEIGTEHVGASNRNVAIKTAANVFAFNRGSSDVTPNMVIYNSTSKAISLLTGTAGSSLTFDDTGYFAITKDTKANLTGGSTAGGTELIAVTSGGLLTFAGRTSSFPAVKRSTTILQARLADDSAFATFQGKLQADVNAVAETPAATHTITIYDGAGTAYKVLCVAA